jgi:hypothetical protein
MFFLLFVHLEGKTQLHNMLLMHVWVLHTAWWLEGVIGRGEKLKPSSET